MVVLKGTRRSASGSSYLIPAITIQIESVLEMIEDGSILDSQTDGLNKTNLDRIAAGMQLAEYKVVKLLGRGGMGVVYEVRHRFLEKSYAIKVLPQAFAARENALQRFQTDAKVMAGLDHPNITRVDDSGVSDGVYWLRMELATGDTQGSVSLQDMADLGNGRIDPRRLKALMMGVLNGVAWAHSKGIVHGNLKPANILLFMDDKGEPKAKVSDYGFVGMLGEEYLRSSMMGSDGASGDADGSDAVSGSSSRALMGTWEYMAPDQQDGQPVHVRGDVYSLGLIFYRLLTGESLSPKTPSMIVPGLGGLWDKFVLKALEIDPEKRYANAVEMRDAFQGIEPREFKSEKATPVPVRRESLERIIAGKTRPYFTSIYSRTGIRIIKMLAVIALSFWVLHMMLDGLRWLSPPVTEGNQESEVIVNPAKRLLDFVLGPNEMEVLMKEMQVQSDLSETRREGRPEREAEKRNYPRDDNEENGTGIPARVMIDGENFIDFVAIAPGSFTLSVKHTQKNGYQPEIFVDKFWMAQTRITQGVYKSITGANPCRFKDDGKPVGSLTWHDANAFCSGLSSRLGITFSLPTDAQWERACRCFNGQQDAVKSGNNRFASCVIGLQENGREWCMDWFASDGLFSGSKSNPTGPRIGISRVVRGGDASTGQDLTGLCAVRKGLNPSYFDTVLGFRVVTSTDPARAKTGLGQEQQSPQTR